MAEPDRFEKRIEGIDTDLFAMISSQTTDDDRRTLLSIQRSIRKNGEYAYMEIGSHLGGTIQPHYLDPRCSLIYSIDKRPRFQPDERGCNFEYPDNSTERMLDYIEKSFPGLNINKIKTFDCDAGNVSSSEITKSPVFCFIDGEHTNSAAYTDFISCLELCHPNAVIAFHDSQYIFEGIRRVKKHLVRRGIRFRGLMLGGSVYGILLGEAVDFFGTELNILRKNEFLYFGKSRIELMVERSRNRCPRLWNFLRSCKDLGRGIVSKKCR